VIAAILSVAAPAHAEMRLVVIPDASEEVGPAMQRYFDGEIRGGWILTGMGVGGIAAGSLLYANGGDVARGASYMTFGFGAVHLAAGIFVNIASRSRKTKFQAQIDRDSSEWLDKERQRMKGVSRQFLILEIVEVLAIAGGGTMAYLGHEKDRPKLEGAGYALMAESAATLVFDIVASRRAHRYRRDLKEANNTAFEDTGPMLMVARDVSNAPILLVGRGYTF
jgi:hypothetical protein